MDKKRGTLSTYLSLAAVAGFISIIARAFLFSSGTGAVVVGIVIDIALIVLIVLSVIEAKKHLDRATLRSSLVGVIYGGVTAIGSLLFPVSAAVLRTSILRADPSIPSSVLNSQIALDTSTVMRVLQAVLAVVFSWLLALLVGWIASKIVRSPEKAA